MKKIGFVLSGCGVYDGAEIHESVLSMLALLKKGFELIFLAPDMEQVHVVNHHEGQQDPSAQPRNVLIEAARIARGEVTNIAEVSADDLDGLFFSGGFGAAKNLCNLAFKGPDATVQPDVEKLVKACHQAKKPLGFICIAPAIAAKVIGNGVRLTIGTDEGTGAALEAMGATHVPTAVDEVCVDEENLLVTAPAYMLAASIVELEIGINKAVDAYAALFD